MRTHIVVDRNIRPVYPVWVKEALHPNLELTGPAEYNLTSLMFWLHDDQTDETAVEGTIIYEHLKEKDILKDCLSLRDGEEIKRLKVDVFRKFFGDALLFFWKSVVCSRKGELHVPYATSLFNDGEITVRWAKLVCGWYKRDRALVFRTDFQIG